jgi:hypothetical protein
LVADAEGRGQDIEVAAGILANGGVHRLTAVSRGNLSCRQEC